MLLILNHRHMVMETILFAVFLLCFPMVLTLFLSTAQHFLFKEFSLPVQWCPWPWHHARLIAAKNILLWGHLIFPQSNESWHYGGPSLPLGACASYFHLSLGSDCCARKVVASLLTQALIRANLSSLKKSGIYRKVVTSLWFKIVLLMWSRKQWPNDNWQEHRTVQCLCRTW